MAGHKQAPERPMMTTTPQRQTKTRSNGNSAATTSYEAVLWRMADALRGSMDAAEYKHVVLGLIFLKYISDAFEEAYAELEAEVDQGADPEDPDEYRAQNIFWVPVEARWPQLQTQARQATIGQAVDEAMTGIERDNPVLKDVLPKDYARPSLDKQRLGGQIIDLISNIQIGDQEARSKDVLGRVYEYFLSQFASAERKKGGEFYTPRSVVKLLVEMLEPYQGRVYDPCCGSSGMFVQSVEFIRAHASGNGNGGRARGDISIYGQESNYTTWRLAKMNLAIRGIEGQIAHGDSFHNDRHPDLKADFILANPPFNISDWGGERLLEDKRWQHGAPPKGNANFAWVQHMAHHLSPTGTAGFVLANGSMSSNQSGEGNIRKLGFTHFKRRKRGNLQVGGIERWGVPACRGWLRTVKNPLTPATGGVAPGRWRPRRWATACRTRPPCVGSWGAVFATRGRPGWSRRRAPAGRAWCGRWRDRTTGVGSPHPGGFAPPER